MSEFGKPPRLAAKALAITAAILMSPWFFLLGLRELGRRLVCWVQGHNLIGVNLPAGWSKATCRMCGREIDAFKKKET